MQWYCNADVQLALTLNVPLLSGEAAILPGLSCSQTAMKRLFQGTVQSLLALVFMILTVHIGPETRFSGPERALRPTE